MKLFGYALAVVHSQTKQTRIATGFVITDSKTNAEKLITEHAFKTYPQAKKWTRHQFRVVQAQDTYSIDGQEFQTLVEVNKSAPVESEQVL